MNSLSKDPISSLTIANVVVLGQQTCNQYLEDINNSSILHFGLVRLLQEYKKACSELNALKIKRCAVLSKSLG